VHWLWPITVEQFFANFWPNLVATVGGVAIGIPAGLFLSNLAQRRQAESERGASNERLYHGLDVLTVAVRENLQLLKQVQTAFGKPNAYVTGLPLNTSAWDAAKADITPALRNTKLKVQLASHFEQLTLFSSHVERHAEYFIGMPATLFGAESIRQRLGNQLVEFTNRLVTEAEQLLADFATTQAALGGAVPRLPPNSVELGSRSLNRSGP
jgi:hypothetical protein